MQPNLRREIRVLCKRQSGGGSDEVGWPWRERRVQRDETSRLFLHQNVLQLQYLAREPLHIAGNLFLRVEQRSASSSFALFSSPRPVLGSSMASECMVQEICPLWFHKRDTDSCPVRSLLFSPKRLGGLHYVYSCKNKVQLFPGSWHSKVFVLRCKHQAQ